MTSPWLIDTTELAAQLADPQLRLFDTHVFLMPKPGGGYTVESGRDAWRREHIPGASFIDVQSDLSDPTHSLRYMMPPEQQFREAMSRLGVGPQHRVVLYNRGPTWWATRVFFMLREFGFDAVRVLDGGLDKWQQEGRPLQSGEAWYPPAEFPRTVRRRLFVDSQHVLQAINEDNAVVVNALSAELFSGKLRGYARPGRIARSCSLPAKDLLDPVTQAFLPATELRARLGAAGLLGGKPVIAYCGGGISATTDAFALLLLGHDNVSIYDGSLNEWALDPALPMESDF